MVLRKTKLVSRLLEDKQTIGLGCGRGKFLLFVKKEVLGLWGGAYAVCSKRINC